MTAGPTASSSRFGLVVVIGSLGAFAAASAVLDALPADFAVPLVLVHHRAVNSDDTVEAGILQAHTSLPVRIARSGMPVAERGVTLVPAAREAVIDAELRYQLEELPAGRTRSEGDRLLGSVAAALGPAAIGVVLTGLLKDGTEGVRAIKRRGGRVLAEDPATARAASMPTSAIATGCVDFVLPVERMAAALVALTMAPGGAELLTVPTPSWARLRGSS